MISTILVVVAIYFTLKATLWLWKILWGVRKKPKPKHKGQITFAVAIPAHNEGASIARTVRSILLAGIPAEDIFILCNGCSDNTAEEVQRCGVKPVVVPVRGKEETLTYAIETLKLFSRYSHVCFFDADTEVDRSYFRFTRERLRDDATIDIICGKPKSLPYNWLTAHRAVQYWAFHAVHKSAQAEIGAILVVPGCAGTYSTRSLKKIVWSPDTRIGDMDATIQAALLGMNIAFEPRSFVLTQDPSHLRDYTSQLYWRWYRGLWMNMRKHGILWKGPFSMLHWSCRLMFFDQFLPFLYLGAVWYFSWNYSVVGALSVFGTLVVLETVMCAQAEKRWDVLKYIPIFPLMRVYDTLLFLGSSWNIFVRREKSGVWKSPTRYDTTA